MDWGTSSPIAIASQGARAFGGRVMRDATGATAHVDHGYDEWSIPVRPRSMPLVLWHSSSTWTWEASFSGGDGFKTMFLRRGFPVHVIDAPQLGRAGWSGSSFHYEPEIGYDQTAFNSFRLGLWDPPAPPAYYPNVQFPADDAGALDQLLRAAYPEFNVPDNVQLQAEEVGKLLDELHGAALVTHSGSGVRGWRTALYSASVRGIVSYEPNSFVLPEGEVPPPLERADGRLVSAQNDPLGSVVAVEEFRKLTNFPIQIIFGDNIPAHLDRRNVGFRLPLDNRRLGLIRARIFADAVNRHGGDAQVLELPDLGVTGNTHFPMQDLNNATVAELLLKFLDEQGLAGYPAAG
jgi:hypothetical protein